MTGKKEDWKLIPVRFPRSYLRMMERLIPSSYPNRSELIRTATRKLVLEELRIMKWTEKARSHKKARTHDNATKP